MPLVGPARHTRNIAELSDSTLPKRDPQMVCGPVLAVLVI
jgi:hypothetical protein